jgi:L-lactate dehydrogenase complex protein LldG
MSSKEDILASIRKNTKNRYEYPDWQINATVYPDVVAKFCEMSFAVGGEAIVLGEGEDINAVIRRTYPDAGSIASDLEEITCATFNPDLLGRAQDLNGTDIAVVKGEIGVAENAAVWIPQTVKYKALYFIAEKLVIVLDKNRIVSNMHQAYERIKDEKYKFGTFISGPSKTADIDTSNNFWGTFSEPTKFQVFKDRQQQRARGVSPGMVNPMQAAGKKN